MTAPLRLVLFAEGSESPPSSRSRQVLARIWNERLAVALELPLFERVFPISKTHLVAMDPTNPPMSGAGERLDQLIARMLKQTPFDAALVAWDLCPPWNPEGEYCRWTETVDLYRFLAESDCLPDLWRRRAQLRYQELNGRPKPSERSAPPIVEPGSILPLCMEPMFESLLVQDEGAVRRAMGVEGTSVKGWPKRGWGDAGVRRPDQDLLAPAVRALLNIRPKRDVLRLVRGDMKTHKSEWGELLLRRMIDDARARHLITEHPIARRLSELLLHVRS